MSTVYELYRPRRRVKEEGFSIEVEAEMEMDFEGRNSNTFGVKRDGSLLGNAFEYVSKKVLSRQDLVKALEEELFTEKFLKKYKKSQRTSTHVHVNMQNRTKEELFTILGVYYLSEYLLFQFTEAHRRDNLFCLPMYSAEHSEVCLQHLWDAQPAPKMDDFKYAALNISNLYTFGTIEFRHLEGTSDLKKIKTWLAIIEDIVKSREKFSSIQEVYREFGKNPLDFFKKVFGARLKAFGDVPYDHENINLSFSKLFDILDHQTRPKKRAESYLFANARGLDDINFEIFAVHDPKRTKPMEL